MRQPRGVPTAVIPPSGAQYELRLGNQRAIVVEVGGGLREYEVDGQAVLDVTSDALRRRILDAADKGELSFPPPPKTSVTVVNENDQVFVDSKMTPHPIETCKQPIKLSGGIEKVAKKIYIRLPKYPDLAFDKALAECKGNKSWRTFELSESGHMAMFDVPERLTDLLLQAAY